MNLVNINLTDDYMNLLREYLENNEELQDLDISINNISDKGVEMLSESLVGKTNLKNLNIARNSRITNGSVISILKLVKN